MWSTSLRSSLNLGRPRFDPQPRFNGQRGTIGFNLAYQDLDGRLTFHRRAMVVRPEVDHMALNAICSAVPPEMISTLATKPSVKQAWESIKTMRTGADRVGKVSAQKLRRKYEQLSFRDSKSD
jgi:hypothetical protein